MVDKPRKPWDPPADPIPSDNYRVGYRKPPKETQFKPGQSGNPKGRKKKPESVADQVARILSKRITVKEGGKTKRLSLQEVMLTTFVNQAAKGDLKAARFVLDLAESYKGKSDSTIDPDVLDADSQAIIEAFLHQRNVGEAIADGDPEFSDAAAIPGGTAPDCDEAPFSAESCNPEKGGNRDGT